MLLHDYVHPVLVTPGKDPTHGHQLEAVYSEGGPDAAVVGQGKNLDWWDNPQIMPTQSGKLWTLQSETCQAR